MKGPGEREKEELKETARQKNGPKIQQQTHKEKTISK
jgi:hypothetical protein